MIIDASHDADYLSVAFASLNRNARTAIKRQHRAWNVVRTVKTIDRIPQACTKSSPDAADHIR
jgi:hypothetical protein